MAIDMANSGRLQSSAASLDDAVNQLISASRIPARQREGDISDVVNLICEEAYERGVPSSVLQRLLEMLTSKTTLDQSSTTSLIKNLFPAQRVSTACVLRLVSCLGLGNSRPTTASQGLLLQWLFNVYSVLEDLSILSRLYSVLFGLLDMISLRPGLCQLLCLITRRRHVKPFRVQQLFELQKVAGTEPGLNTLISIYKNYCPDIILNSMMGRVRATSAFKAGAAWRVRLEEIQASRGFGTYKGGLASRSLVGNGHVAGQSGRHVPRLYTLRAQEATTTLEDIQDVRDLVHNLDKISPPTQMAASLKNSLLQNYLQLSASRASQLRLEFWLAQCLDELLETASEAAEAGSTASASQNDFEFEMMQVLLEYTKSSKTTPESIMTFLQKYLPSWRGRSNVNTILEILTYLPTRNFRTLHRDYLRFVEASLGRHNSNCLELLSTLYESLLRRHMLRFPKSGPSDNNLFVRQLLDHVNVLHLSALVSLSEGNWTTSSIVRFYEALSHLSRSAATSPAGAAAVVLPTPHTVYLLGFSFQLDAISRLCSIMTAYKAAFETGMRASVRWPTDFTAAFNGYLMDICNLLWRSRALTREDPNSMGCLCPDTILASLRSYLITVDREYNLASAFGFPHHVAMCNLSFKALRSLEDQAEARSDRTLVRHVGPASQRTLSALEKEGGAAVSWKEYRLSTLKWLDEHAVSGIKELMFVTMKDLMKAAG